MNQSKTVEVLASVMGKSAAIINNRCCSGRKKEASGTARLFQCTEDSGLLLGHAGVRAGVVAGVGFDQVAAEAARRAGAAQALRGVAGDRVAGQADRRRAAAG